MSEFSRKLLRWQKQHGRHDLPWQNTTDPYRVWLSEIMLQQTQVVTALDYYPRFLQRFTDVHALANASEDEVLALWSGLGYYSRARNLHRCAQAVCAQHGGEFPRAARMLATLPGIGPTTAAAIAAFCFGERVSIMDGNVQRVLSRLTAMPHEISSKQSRDSLAQVAAEYLPARSADMPVYTQGLMDLGATCCTPRQPKCEVCPVVSMCAARETGEPERFPVKTRKLKRSSQRWWMLLAMNRKGELLLEQRPAKGIWARLWAPPLFASEVELLNAATGAGQPEYLEPFVHVLTHRDLHLHPVILRGARVDLAGQWLTTQQWQQQGLPAPVRKLLNELN
jgi:A/G-specific adenine glycosylase